MEKVGYRSPTQDSESPSDDIPTSGTEAHLSDSLEKPTISLAEDIEKTEHEIRVPTTFTEDEYRKVIRKLDWNIMPMILVLYSLSVLDRSNLGNARLAGLEDDVDIAGDRYSWLGMNEAYSVLRDFDALLSTAIEE